MSLRAQVLAGLAFLVTLTILSVGILVVGLTAHALAEDLTARAGRAAQTAARTIALSAAGASLDAASSARTRTTDALLDVGAAVGADDLLLLDRRLRPLVASPPASAAALSSEPRLGLVAAGGGPLVEEGSLVRAYAPVELPGGRVLGVVALGFERGKTLARALGPARLLLIGLCVADAVVLLLAGWLVLGRAVVAPVVRLEAAAGKVAEGNLTVRVPESGREIGVGEIARLGRAFNRMTTALAERQEQLVRSEKLASVGRLAAGVAHEIGNPLAAVLGYVDLLLGGPALADDARDLLLRVRGETRRIDRTIQELLAFARPGATGAEAAAVPVTLAPLVEQALALCRPQARFRELDVTVDVPRDLPAVRAAGDRIVQVLVNLLLNAADSMEAAAAARRLRVEAAASGDRIELAVVDSGPGVPADLRTRIFDPFYTTKDPGRGTGLGLFVSASIVSALGGQLTLAEQRQGEGARFVLALPRSTT